MPLFYCHFFKWFLIAKLNLNRMLVEQGVKKKVMEGNPHHDFCYVYYFITARFCKFRGLWPG